LQDVAKFNSKVSTQLTPASLRTGELGLIALLLLFEKAAGDSKWAAYINSLPSAAPGILSWSTEEQQEFAQSTTRDFKAQLAAVEADYKLVCSLSRPLMPASVLTLESFTWAMGVVKSRALFIDNKACLVPGVDALSFDPFSSAEPFAAPTVIWGAKLIKVVADRSYEAGEEVFMSFGLKSSAECLEDHGIVPLLDMADTCAELTVAIEDTDRFPDDKVNILEDAGLSARERFDLEAEIGVDPLLLQFLRLKFIEGKDSFILEACFADSVFNTMSLPFSRPNEMRVYSYLKDTVASLLDKINSVSSEEQDAKLVGADASATEGVRRKALLAELRQQERTALRGTLEVVRMEIQLLEGNGLDTKEYYQERRLRDLNLLRPLDESEIVMPGDRPSSNDDY
jgi:hypothetical protein